MTEPFHTYVSESGVKLHFYQSSNVIGKLNFNPEALFALMRKEKVFLYDSKRGPKPWTEPDGIISIIDTRSEEGVDFLDKHHDFLVSGYLKYKEKERMEEERIEKQWIENYRQQHQPTTWWSLIKKVFL